MGADKQTLGARCIGALSVALLCGADARLKVGNVVNTLLDGFTLEQLRDRAQNDVLAGWMHNI